MDMRPDPFVPPAPVPRTVPPSRLEIIRTIQQLLELKSLLHAPSSRRSSSANALIIVNDPGLIKHVLVDNAANYRMSDIRQLILRPIPARRLADGRGRGLEAFAQGRSAGLHAAPRQWLRRLMLRQSEDYIRKYEMQGSTGKTRDRQRHGRTHFRHPCRHAVFGRDRHLVR